MVNKASLLGYDWFICFGPGREVNRMRLNFRSLKLNFYEVIKIIIMMMMMMIIIIIS